MSTIQTIIAEYPSLGLVADLSKQTITLPKGTTPMDIGLQAKVKQQSVDKANATIRNYSNKNKTVLTLKVDKFSKEYFSWNNKFNFELTNQKKGSAPILTPSSTSTGVLPPGDSSSSQSSSSTTSSTSTAVLPPGASSSSQSSSSTTSSTSTEVLPPGDSSSSQSSSSTTSSTSTGVLPPGASSSQSSSSTTSSTSTVVLPPGDSSSSQPSTASTTTTSIQGSTDKNGEPQKNCFLRFFSFLWNGLLALFCCKSTSSTESQT